MTHRVHKRCFAYATLALLLMQVHEALASGRSLEITLSGNLTESYSQDKKNSRKSWGAELRLPLTSFFQVSLGHNFLEDKDTYNEEYRATQEALGYVLPEGDIITIDTYIDTTANGALYYTFGYIQPSIFGGALWRTYCYETPVADYGCQEQDMTWNAGAALSIVITYNLRLRTSYRISPSLVKDPVESERFDTSTSFGLTLVL